MSGHTSNASLATNASSSAGRLRAAALVLGALLLATLYFVRPALLLVMPALSVLIPIVVVTAHWLGLQLYGARQPQTVRGMAVSFLTVAVASVAGPMTTREPDEWLPIVPLIAAVTVTGFLVHTIYARRVLQYAIVGSVDRLSADGVRAHFTGYLVGFAAGIAAATLVRTQLALGETWLWSGVAYGIAFAVGKLAADLLSPRPSPFRQPNLSAALVRMTGLSPLWWGLPWAIAFAGYNAVVFNARLEGGLRFFLMDALSNVLHVVAAVTFVLAALTILTYLQEVFLPRRERQDLQAEALTSGDWARLFSGVVLLSFAAGLFVYRPLGPSDEELFGTETWKCARDGDEYKLGWIAREGVHITNLRGGFDFFDLSCVPRARLRGGCKYDRENWDEVVIVIKGRSASKTVTFTRRDPDVKYGGLYGKSALSLLETLYEGTSAEMTVKAPKGRVLYVLHIDLKGFRPELDKCIAHWDRNPPPKR